MPQDDFTAHDRLLTSRTDLVMGNVVGYSQRNVADGGVEKTPIGQKNSFSEFNEPEIRGGRKI